MTRSIRGLLIITALAAAAQAATQAVAQEGHPFDGTWRGTLSDDTGETRRLLLILDYDGEQIGGMINPGPASIPIQTAELDAAQWELSVQAESPEGPIEFVATLHEIGAHNRFMEGTWIQGGSEYDFRVTRE